MARTAVVLLPLILSLLFNLTSSSSVDTNNTTKSKRQIFREQVNPQAGGRIPEDAFRSDRLALNRLNKEGIAVPDGVVLEARHRESHYGSHRHDPDIQASIVKVVLGEDGRYAPPEGRYPFNSLVESTYVLRPPINTPVIAVPPQRPQLATLRLPARPYFQQDHSAFNSLDQHIDFFNSFDPSFPANGLWTGLLGPVPDVPNRLLRRQAKIPLDDIVAQHSNLDSKVAGSRSKVPTSKEGGSQLSVLRGRPVVGHSHNQPLRTAHEGRSLRIFQHPTRLATSEQSHSPHSSYTNAHPQPERSNDDYENRLVPVYLTPHNEQNYQNYESQKEAHYIPYISQDPNFQKVLPVVNVPLSPNPNYYFQDIDPSNRLPIEKTVESRPHYVLDSSEKDTYNPQTEKTLIPVQHQTYTKADVENQFHNVVQNPHVSSALFEEHGHPSDRYKDIPKPNYQSHGPLEEQLPIPNPNIPPSPNHQSPQQQSNVLLPVPLSHNQPSPLIYNQFKPNSFPQPNTNIKDTAEKQNIQYQLVNSFSNLDTDYHNHKSSQSHEYNKLVKYNKDSRENSGENKDDYLHQNIKYVPNDQHHANINYRNPNTGTNSEESARKPGSQHDGRWQQTQGNSLKILSHGNEDHGSGNRGVQYVRGGLHFEVVNDQLGVRQQSRGEVGQKSLSNPSQEPSSIRSTKTTDVGSKHLNQVLHYIEPHEVVHQISTAPSIEHEYPSLDTVPETSFVCRGPGRAMLPDPETSCQVFHLCSGDGSKESFLCPKGSRYDASKQQCAPWTQVTCHA